MIKTMLHGSFTNEKMANNTSLNFGCYIVLNTDIVKTVTFREPGLYFTIKNEQCVNESL